MARLVSISPPPETPKPSSIVVEMTGDEASALAALFWRVGGSPDKSGRGLIDNVAGALYDAGFKPSVESHRFPVKQGAMFRDGGR
jgi:hypothetical protein